MNSAMVLECQAVLMGINIADVVKVKRLILEGNVLSFIQTLRSNPFALPLEIGNIMYDKCSILHSFDEVEFNHIHGFANGSTHVVPKCGSHTLMANTWTSSPLRWLSRELHLPREI